ncbi:MAG: DUF6624 domain-containing protein, partial [Acidobacteriota bacterium]
EDQELVADLLLRASRSTDRPDWETLLYASTLFAEQGRLEKALDAFDLSIAAGLRDPDLAVELPALEPVRLDDAWPQRLERVRAARAAYLDDIADPQLFEELDAMWRQDQEAHRRWSEAQAGEEATRDLMAVLQENQNRLDAIIDEVGWPGFKLVGEDGAKLSWAIAQHAQSVEFQRKCLRLIAAAVARGDDHPQHYAELHDRIARQTWQRQLFGASMASQAPYPIEDEARVDARRARLGLLEPVEYYAAAHGLSYRVPSPEQAERGRAASRERARQLLRELEAAIDRGDVASSRRIFREASALHGDLSSLELYDIVGKLASANWRSSDPNDAESKAAESKAADSRVAGHLSLRILHVIADRRWSHRFAIPSDGRLTPLHGLDGWRDVVAALKQP